MKADLIAAGPDGLYRKELFSVHPSRQFLFRGIPKAELAVSEGVFRTVKFGRFRSSGTRPYVRFWLKADVKLTPPEGSPAR